MTRVGAADGVRGAARGVLAGALAGLLVLPVSLAAQDHVHAPAPGSSLPANHSMDSRDLPGDEAHAAARLNASPRRDEWVSVRAGAQDVKTWIVYPERRRKAAVVVVVHDADGLNDWVRNIADQFASEGFIALAPDLALVPQSSLALDAVARYGRGLPAASGRSAVIGFGAGAAAAIVYAATHPDLDAAVAYDAPAATLPAPSVNSRPAILTLSAGNFPGAAPGFLRDQMGRDANMIATEKAWPQTIAFLRKYVETPR